MGFETGFFVAGWVWLVLAEGLADGLPGEEIRPAPCQWLEVVQEPNRVLDDNIVMVEALGQTCTELDMRGNYYNVSTGAAVDTRNLPLETKGFGSTVLSNCTRVLLRAWNEQGAQVTATPGVGINMRLGVLHIGSRMSSSPDPGRQGFCQWDLNAPFIGGFHEGDLVRLFK